jgi:hypothetical protein
MTDFDDHLLEGFLVRGILDPKTDRLRRRTLNGCCLNEQERSQNME